MNFKPDFCKKVWFECKLLKVDFPVFISFLMGKFIYTHQKRLDWFNANSTYSITGFNYRNFLRNNWFQKNQTNSI